MHYLSVYSKLYLTVLGVNAGINITIIISLKKIVNVNVKYLLFIYFNNQFLSLLKIHNTFILQLDFGAQLIYFSLVMNI